MTHAKAFMDLVCLKWVGVPQGQNEDSLCQAVWELKSLCPRALVIGFAVKTEFPQALHVVQALPPSYH